MKMCRMLSCLGTVAVLAACSGRGTSIPTFAVTAVPTQMIEPRSSETSVVTPEIEIAPSAFVPPTILVPIYPSETRMQAQCLGVETTSVSAISSSGILVLENRASLDEGHYKSGTFHMDMQSGQITEITLASENQVGHIVSPNRELVAYENVAFNNAGKVKNTELVIANTKDQHLSVIPWEDEWILMPAWLDNESLIINAAGLNSKEDAGDKPDTMLVLNPFNGKRQILKPDFPRILNTHPTVLDMLPFWEGWSGVIYDPTLTRAIYPRFIGDNDERYSYAVWDVSEQRLIATLDEVFASSSSFGGNFPMPVWSADGSRFVFQGFNLDSDPLKFELYEVHRDGQTKQLTQLSSVAYVWESSYSWSPDGRYIAMFLGSPLGAAFDPFEKAHVAVLDTETLNVTDYCVSITFSGEGYGAGGPVWSPIWSPDGEQFVIMDWYEKEHRRVILVDIEKNIATQVAEDMEPVGWMIAP